MIDRDGPAKIERATAAEQGSEGERKINSLGKPMSQNLNLLRQNYCRLATFTGKRTRCLFPLERECEQGKTLLAKAPKTLLHLQEFDPYGLQQTYRDEATGAELPVFAVFDLEGNHQFAVEIRRIRSPQLPSLTAFPRTFHFKRPKHS
jgi:hypothetical protein